MKREGGRDADKAEGERRMKNQKNKDSTGEKSVHHKGRAKSPSMVRIGRTKESLGEGLVRPRVRVP